MKTCRTSCNPGCKNYGRKNVCSETNVQNVQNENIHKCVAYIYIYPRETSFHYRGFISLCALLCCNYFQNRKETYCSVDLLFVSVKFSIFYFLCCKRDFSRKRGNERLSCVARELSVSLLILCLYNIFKDAPIRI